MTAMATATLDIADDMALALGGEEVKVEVERWSKSSCRGLNCAAADLSSVCEAVAVTVRNGSRGATVVFAAACG